MTERERRINEIPHEIKELKKQLNYARQRNWIMAASRIRKKIGDCEREFSELYESYGRKNNEEIQN